MPLPQAGQHAVEQALSEPDFLDFALRCFTGEANAILLQVVLGSHAGEQGRFRSGKAEHG